MNDEARSLLPMSVMLRLGRAMIVGLAALGAGCGQITFGGPIDVGERDAGPDRDGGEAPRDAGVRDTGPMGDAGCMPHPLPGFPDSWPWKTDPETLDKLFIESFTAAACFSCHANGASGAEVVFAQQGASPGDYDLSATNLWNVLTTSQEASFDTATPVGRLWFHHPNYVPMPGEDNDPIYDPMDPEESTLVTRMNNLLRSAVACNNTLYAQMPADAGSNCGTPTSRDGGPMSETDAGEIDGGVRDGGSSGSGSGGLCYCELMLNYTPDLLLYCAE